MTPFERRIAKLEAAMRAAVKVPHVLFVRAGETIADAVARFNAAFPSRLADHRLLILPAKPSNAAEQADYERRMEAHQLALVAAARSARIAPVAAPALSSSSTVIRPKRGPVPKWVPNNAKS